MPAPIMDHCDRTEDHLPHFWMPEGDNIYEDAYHWCNGEAK